MASEGTGGAMDYREVQDILTNDIEELKRLRDTLSNEGKPLAPRDKRLIIHQLSGSWLHDIQREQRAMFREMSIEDIQANFRYITTTMEQFS